MDTLTYLDLHNIAEDMNDGSSILFVPLVKFAECLAKLFEEYETIVVKDENQLRTAMSSIKTYKLYLITLKDFLW